MLPLSAQLGTNSFERPKHGLRAGGQILFCVQRLHTIWATDLGVKRAVRALRGAQRPASSNLAEALCKSQSLCCVH